MAQTTQFDKLRRQRRRKKRVRRLITGALTLAILAVALLGAAVVYQLDLATQVQNFAVSAFKTGGGFPVSTRDIRVRAVHSMGRDVVVVADSGTFVYNKNGALLLSRMNQYTQPVVRISGGKILTYDLGGHGVRVDNKAKELHTMTTDGRLYAADLAPSGHLATAASAEGFLAHVTVYSPTFEERYNWYTNECYITDLRLSPRGDRFCAAGVSGGGDGRLVGQLWFHHTGKKDEAAQVLLPGELVISLAWTPDSRVQVVTDRSAYLYDQDGGQVAQTPLPGGITHVEQSPDGGLYLAHGDYRSAGGAVVEAYDKDLRHTGSYATDRRILSLEAGDGRLLILTEGRLMLGDADLAQVQQRRDADLYYVCGAGNMIYGITPQGLIREEL